MPDSRTLAEALNAPSPVRACFAKDFTGRHDRQEDLLVRLRHTLDLDESSIEEEYMVCRSAYREDRRRTAVQTLTSLHPRADRSSSRMAFARAFSRKFCPL